MKTQDMQPLRQFMEDRGLSQQDLGAMIGVSQNKVSQLLRNHECYVDANGQLYKLSKVKHPQLAAA